jgi:hypothetical protein
MDFTHPIRNHRMTLLRLAPLALALLFSGCASYYSASVPMTKKMRSSFQPYTGENGDARFVVRNMYFNSEKDSDNQRYYDQWLSEWLTEYQLCKSGYEILSTAKEPFATSSHLGGHAVAHGRCK